MFSREQEILDYGDSYLDLASYSLKNQDSLSAEQHAYVALAYYKLAEHGERIQTCVNFIKMINNKEPVNQEKLSSLMQFADNFVLK